MILMPSEYIIYCLLLVYLLVFIMLIFMQIAQIYRIFYFYKIFELFDVVWKYSFSCPIILLTNDQFFSFSENKFVSPTYCFFQFVNVMFAWAVAYIAPYGDGVFNISYIKYLMI